MTEEVAEQAETLIDVSANTEAENTQEATNTEVTRDETEAAPEAEGLAEDHMYAGKFKSAEELEKGYKELVQKLTEKRPEAPEEYKFDFSENDNLKNLEIDLDDDPTYQKMVPLFKELNLTQEQAGLLVNTYLESAYEAVPDLGDEMKKLGPQANEILEKANAFVAQHLTPEEQEMAKVIGQTAEGVKFLEKMAKMRGEQRLPTDAEAYAAPKPWQEIQAEAIKLRKSTPNFDIDKKAQARYEALMDQAVKIQVGADNT